MACIVCILYIVGKVWIHYKVEDNHNKENINNNNKRVIRRGNEWPE